MFHMSRLPLIVGLVGVMLSMLQVGQADAQLINRLKRAAGRAAEEETTRQLEELVRGKVRCVFDDFECISDAKESGEDVVLTDDGGEVLVDDDGMPVSDPDKGAQIAGKEDKVSRPGEGAWANYDFVPGDEILLVDDYTEDDVGDFPRKFELIEGSFEIIEWEGSRYVRATSGGIFAIPLPKTLPERFTIEYSVNLRHGNAYARIMPARALYGPARTFRGSTPSVEFGRAGIRSMGQGPEVLAQIDHKIVEDGIATVRIMADGEHMKMYLDERRVANVPNAVYPRSDSLFIAVSSATMDRPILIGPVRIAGGGRDLYDRLARDGRVATQGILFATGSARIRAESTPTLEEIGTMLKAHPDLRLSIEGHTDSDGDDAFNHDLSERRAAAVKDYLVTTYAIDGGRLETVGFGESKPVADNMNPEGKQQNRRVELVKI